MLIVYRHYSISYCEYTTESMLIFFMQLPGKCVIANYFILMSFADASFLAAFLP